MTESTIKEKKVTKKNANVTKKDVIIGIWEFVFICSILYSVAMIALGTKDIVLISLTAPMILFAVATIGKRFIISRQGEK